MTSVTEAQRQLASMSLAVVLLAPGQRIAGANPTAEQFLGQSFRRLADRPLADVLLFDEPRLATRFSESDAHVSARETGVTIAGKGPRRIDLTVAPLLEQPGWQVLTLHDMSGAEAMSESRTSRESGVLRAPEVLAHEIKNPLAGIRGAAQLLSRKLPEGDRKLTSLIADEVDRIAKLIDQMQDLSRQTAQPLTACNLHEAVRRARAVIEARGEAPPILEEFDPSLPPVLGNADGLVQILINLLANACDAVCDADSPRIVVRTRFASGLQLHAGADGRPVRLPIELRVSDNGPGIDAAMRDHVFEPFVSSKKSGQGLGLALVRRLLRDMDGRVGLDRDESGGWTHFHVHLQVAGHGNDPKQEHAA